MIKIIWIQWYKWFKTPGNKDIGIRKFEFVAKKIIVWNGKVDLSGCKDVGRKKSEFVSKTQFLKIIDFRASNIFSLKYQMSPMKGCKVVKFLKI